MFLYLIFYVFKNGSINTFHKLLDFKRRTLPFDCLRSISPFRRSRAISKEVTQLAAKKFSKNKGNWNSNIHFAVFSEVEMDPETALELVKQGSTILLLDVPQYTLVGIDTQVNQINASFFLFGFFL